MSKARSEERHVPDDIAAHESCGDVFADLDLPRPTEADLEARAHHTSPEKPRRVIEERWAEDFIGDPPWFDIPDYPPKRTRTRPPTLDAVLRKAARAGLKVKGAAIYADRVEITFGQPDATKADVEIDTPDGLRRLI
jgi:hypothetical protein